MNLDMMNLDKFNEMAAKTEPIDGTMKFSLGNNVFYIDGTGERNVVTNEDKDADCSISMAEGDFKKLIAGDLNPMMAVMSGKIKIKGDMGMAMKLQGLIK